MDATGVTLSVMRVATATDVLSAIQHVTNLMFCAIPERAGMNSTRISEVLNYQKNIPPLVSLAHVHALISASSKTERQINDLIANGQIRRIKVIGRGNDISGVSDSLILTSSLEALLRQSDVDPSIIDSYLSLLLDHPRATILPPSHLPPAHLTALTRAGFLVSASTHGNSARSSTPLTTSDATSTASISRAHSGTSGAIGGEAAFETLGGVGAPRHSSTSTSPQTNRPLGTTAQLLLSLPNLGAYTRLLSLSRAHLLHLLSQSAYNEAPLYLLKERWDGAVDSSESSASRARQVRGVFSGILPAKTKKWKKLWGVRFEWALEECLGAGLVEVFETRSVGLGVRIVGR